MSDLNPVHLKTALRILAGLVPGCEVLAFGSRITRTAKTYFDLDLAVVANSVLDSDTLVHLREAIEESTCPSAWTCWIGKPSAPRSEL